MPDNIESNVPLASVVLSDFKTWLRKKKLNSPAYYTNAKSSLQKYEGGSISRSISAYSKTKSLSYQSQIKRFEEFLRKRSIEAVSNDLEKKIRPGKNPVINCFISSVGHRLFSKASPTTYATILNNYFRFVRYDYSAIDSRTAELFILERPLSSATRRLYKSVINSFCSWAIEFKGTPKSKLSRKQLAIVSQLQQMSLESLSKIPSIDVRTSPDVAGSPGEILSFDECEKLLSLSTDLRENAMISLMAWNGLRASELVSLYVKHCDFKTNKISVRSSGVLKTVTLFETPKMAIKKYLKSSQLEKGKLFPKSSRQKIDRMVARRIAELRGETKRTAYMPFNLRRTAAHHLVEMNVRLDDIQKTLRLASLERVKAYVPDDADNYFKRMPADVNFRGRKTESCIKLNN